MGTRLPPSHAPAWGRRGRDEVAETQRGEGANDRRPVGREGSFSKTDGLIDRISTREADFEDRNKQRRIDEEAYRQQLEQRTHENRNKRVHFENKNCELRGDERDRHDAGERSANARSERQQEAKNDRGRRGSDLMRPPGAERNPQDPSNGRQAILRATNGIDRAAQHLLHGQGPEAHLVLARESMEARSSARGFDRSDPMARVLSALAANMDVRSDAVRTSVPADAKRLAHRMDQVARATETRADNLSAAGSTRDAGLLRNVACDSHCQAALLRAGAANLEALIGRAIARMLSGVAKETSPKSELMLDRALRDLDRVIEEDRVPFHRLLGKEPPQAKKKKTATHTQRALDILRTNDRSKGLLDPLRELSIAICRGDPRATADARNAVLEALSRTGQMPHLERVLNGLPGARTTSSAVELLEQGLPRLFLDGVKNGTIKDLVKNGGLDPWLRSLPGMSEASRRLLPGERALAAQGAPLLPTDLGPIEALLLGGPSFFSAQGTVTSYLSAKGLDTIPLSFAGDPTGFMMLPPAGRHESAVLLAPDGAIMVRSDEGPLFFHGHLNGADEQRYYYNTVPLDEELRRVMYQNAGDPTHRHVRIDMGIDLLLDEGDEGEDTPSKSKKKQDVEQGDSAENLAAIALYDGSSAGLQGFATRFSARYAQDEIDRVNQDLSEDARIGHLYLEFASDCGQRLTAMGYPNGPAFQDQLTAAIEAKGFSAESVGALILIAPGSGTIAQVASPDPKDPELLQESLVLYPCSVVID